MSDYVKKTVSSNTRVNNVSEETIKREGVDEMPQFLPDIIFRDLDSESIAVSEESFAIEDEDPAFSPSDNTEASDESDNESDQTSLFRDELLTYGVNLDILVKLLDRARTALANCDLRVEYWLGEFHAAKAAFNAHRDFLHAHNLLHPGRNNGVRDAGGIVRKEILEGKDDKYKNWVKEHREYDYKVRRLVQGCDYEVQVFGSCLEKALGVIYNMECLENIITKLFMDFTNVNWGQPRSVLFSEMDAWFLENAGRLLELGFEDISDVEGALVTPVDFNILSEREKWKSAHLAMYMLYTARAC